MRSSDWQPIETAPLNEYGKAYGPHILLWCGPHYGPVTAYFDPRGGEECKGGWVASDDGQDIETAHVTHWMPIAAPWPETLPPPRPHSQHQDKQEAPQEGR